jgi:hypothetical protein
MTSEAQRLREQAARCLRLANNRTLPDDVIRQMRALAAEYLQKAQALEKAADQQPQRIGHLIPPPEPSHGAAQQQQQIQSEKPDGDE